MATEPEVSTSQSQPVEPASADAPPAETPPVSLRLWPAIVIVAAMWAALKITATGDLAQTMVQFITMMAAPGVALLLMAVWWLALSGAPIRDRAVGLGLVGLLGAAAMFLSHETMVQPLFALVAPWALTVTVAILLVTSGFRWSWRRWLPVAVWVVAAVFTTTFRNDGITGDFQADLHTRWSPTREEVFLSKNKPGPADSGVAAVELPAELSATDWPEFRGPLRDGRLAGVSFSTDWETNPPRELWRREIGPGWSSFTVVGEVFFTQEQRGKEEVVAAYWVETGEPLWLNQVESRFEETAAGPGPRATPTYHEGRLYTQGAAGKVQCINAATGKALWVRDLTEDTPAKAPMWGFSSSPLVWNDLVITYGGAGEGQSVVAYRLENGEIAWTAGDSTHSYSSPQLTTLGGVEQVLLSSDQGVAAFDPADGTPLWSHPWDIGGMARIVQPMVLGDTVVLGTGYGFGTQLVKVTNADGAWETSAEWTSTRLKPYFNDFVHVDGYLYGFDGPIFTCVNAADGKREWKRGRYGHGQVLLLEDMNVLLVLGEAGELVLMEVNPEKHVELAQVQALEGKTWNHPVITGNRLLVRNGQEAACYELGAASATQVAGP